MRNEPIEGRSSMDTFMFDMPTRFVMEAGGENRLGQLIASFGGTRALVHWGGDYVRDTGLLDRIHASLDAAGVGYVDLDGVVPNPRMALVREGIALCQRAGVDFLLAIGGGSAIDSTKAIAVGLGNPGEDVAGYYRRGIFGEARAIFPFGVLSTTAAAGSEASISSVVDVENEDGSLDKLMYQDPKMRPLFSVLAPDLTTTLPAFQTAAGAVDIVCHICERYFVRTVHTETMDAMAEAIMRTVVTLTPEVLADPGNVDLRANLMWCAAMAQSNIVGIGHGHEWTTHALGNPFSARYDATHGATLSAMFPHWARYVMDADPARFAQFAVNVFGTDPDFSDPKATGLRGIAAYERWCHAIGMPTSISEMGIDPSDEDLRMMARDICAERGGTCGTFRVLDADDVEKIFQNAR